MTLPKHINSKESAKFYLNSGGEVTARVGFGSAVNIIDSTTSALVTINELKNQNHRGITFHIDATSSSLASGSSINICFRTPPLTKRKFHFSSLASTSGAATFQFLRNPTVTVGSGSSAIVYNKNFTSEITSEVLSIEEVPRASNITRNGIITASGTHISVEGLGGGTNKVQGENENLGEFVLNGDETYAIQVTSHAAGNVCTLIGLWSEII